MTSLPEKTTDRLKRQAVKQLNRNYFILSDREYGPELRGRVAVTDVDLNSDSLNRGTSQEVEMTGNGERNLTDRITVFSSPEEYRQETNRRNQKQNDPDVDSRGDVANENKIILLNKEQSAQVIERLQQGKKPGISNLINKNLRGFRHDDTMRQNRSNSRQTNKEQQKKNYAQMLYTASASITIALVGLLAILLTKDYISQKWADMGTNNQTILILTLIYNMFIGFVPRL